MSLHQICAADGKVVGRYFLDSFPACPKIAISHGLEIYPEFRQQGYGTRSQMDRQETARQLGYNLLLATVKVGNVAEEKILQKTGWRKTTEFYNTYSGNDVGLWQCNLNDPYKDWIGPCR